MTDTFFVPDGTSAQGLAFLATDHTRGPWDPDAQHGGPPSALLGHVMETAHARTDQQVVRVTVELLRPVPVARLHVATQVARPGRKVEMLEATLRDDGGSVLALARAWRIRTADVPLTDGQAPADRVEGPDGVAEGRSFFREVPPIGYVQAMETRFASGGWDDPGPATAWLRMRYPLVPDAAPSPLVRTLIAADSGNGVSASFDGLFINPDLTVHLVRPAVGEWVCLQARTTLTDHGVGLAESMLHDARGPFGRGAQTLLLDR